MIFAIAFGASAASSSAAGPAAAGNPELRHMLSNGVVRGLLQNTPPTLERWATSSLASGPFSIRDGRSTTASCEGAPGDGVGEIVIGPPLADDRPLEIWVGYGKSAALFAANGRPTRVRVYLLGAAPHEILETDSGREYRALHVIGSVEAKLGDVSSFQPLPAPPYPSRT